MHELRAKLARRKKTMEPWSLVGWSVALPTTTAVEAVAATAAVATAAAAAAVVVVAAVEQRALGCLVNLDLAAR